MVSAPQLAIHVSGSGIVNARTNYRFWSSTSKTPLHIPQLSHYKQGLPSSDIYDV
jgi:hypothetical protein